jgi:hypothetical protein
MYSGVGQINMGSEFGKEIYNICLKSNINNIFEVGTWNGQGSTVCIMNAIIQKDNSKLYSLEADRYQYDRAKYFWDSKDTNNKLVLLSGVLHREYASENEVKEMYNGQIPCLYEHYIPERNMLQLNPLVNIDDISLIDVIVLDGGEYTTRGDLNVLMKKNPKVVILDDTNVYKCVNIRKEFLSNPEWKLYKESLTDRNGWSIFIHKSYSDTF